MEKKLYFELSDNADTHRVVLPLEGAMAWIEGDIDNQGEDSEIEYTLTPVWMTEEEFSNLPEHD